MQHSLAQAPVPGAVSMGVLQPWEWGGDLGSKVWMWGQLVS